MNPPHETPHGTPHETPHETPRTFDLKYLGNAKTSTVDYRIKTNDKYCVYEVTLLNPKTGNYESVLMNGTGYSSGNVFVKNNIIVVYGNYVEILTRALNFCHTLLKNNKIQMSGPLLSARISAHQAEKHLASTEASKKNYCSTKSIANGNPILQSSYLPQKCTWGKQSNAVKSEDTKKSIIVETLALTVEKFETQEVVTNVNGHINELTDISNVDVCIGSNTNTESKPIVEIKVIEDTTKIVPVNADIEDIAQIVPVNEAIANIGPTTDIVQVNTDTDIEDTSVHDTEGSGIKSTDTLQAYLEALDSIHKFDQQCSQYYCSGKCSCEKKSSDGGTFYSNGLLHIKSHTIKNISRYNQDKPPIYYAVLGVTIAFIKRTFDCSNVLEDLIKIIALDMIWREFNSKKSTKLLNQETITLFNDSLLGIDSTIIGRMKMKYDNSVVALTRYLSDAKTIKDHINKLVDFNRQVDALESPQLLNTKQILESEATEEREELAEREKRAVLEELYAIEYNEAAIKEREVTYETEAIAKSEPRQESEEIQESETCNCKTKYANTMLTMMYKKLIELQDQIEILKGVVKSLALDKA